MAPEISVLLTREERLLILLCRTIADDAKVEDVRKTACENIDWLLFASRANDHGVIALAWNNLKNMGLNESIPAEAADYMHKSGLASLARNSRIFNLLDEVASLAAGENINLILLKGLALEKTIYGNSGLRQMNDLDILVKKEDVIRLRNLLLRNGFRSQPLISPLHEKILPSYGKHMPEMFKNDLSVEIHFKLLNQKGNISTERLIERSLPETPVIHSNVFIPDPLMSFIYLVSHLCGHEDKEVAQLRLYADLHLMLARHYNEIFTGQLHELADEAGIAGALREKLLILKLFWDVNLPSEWDTEPNEALIKSAIEKFLGFLRAPRKSRSEVFHDSLLKPMAGLPGLYKKFLFIAGYIFPSISFMKYRYGAGTMITALLYYPVRWIKLSKLIISGRL